MTFLLASSLATALAFPALAQSDAAPRGMTPTPRSQAPAMGSRPGTPPTDTQCANLLGQAEKVPALRETPDYAYCVSRGK